MTLTNREKEIIQLIRNKPMISQQEIADTLEITRASVAVHITNMMKKGYILGKEYVLNDDNYTIAIGGANMDISGFPSSALIEHDSNPGKVKLSSGGVARNIAENLVHLGNRVKLVTTLGNDLYGKRIIEDAQAVGLDMQDSFILSDMATSTYVSIMDADGDMHVSINHMDIIDHLDVEMITSKRHLIESARTIILDTNIPEAVIDFIMTKYHNHRIFVDPVSSKKALKIKKHLKHIHILKPNRIEAEILSGITIKTEADVKKVANYFIRQGVGKVFISLGSEGVYYADKKKQGKFTPKPQQLVNANGAGDAFSAGLIYTDLLEYDIEDMAKFGSAAAVVALQHENTINPSLSIETVEKALKNIS